MHPLQPDDYIMPSWLQDELEFISLDPNGHIFSIPA